MLKEVGNDYVKTTKGGIGMAVFSIRNDKPFVTKTSIKTSRVQGKHAKALHEYMQNNTVQVKLDSSGKPIVTSKED